LQEHGHQNIWQFAPKECVMAKEEGLAFSNSLFRFLKDQDQVQKSTDVDQYSYLHDIKDAYSRYLGKRVTNALDASIFEQAGWRIKRENKCKSCGAYFFLTEFCCSERSPKSNKTLSPELVRGLVLVQQGAT